MDFRYVAYTRERKLARGTQAAANADIAAKILSGHGLNVLSLKEMPSFVPRWENFLGARRRIPGQVVTSFSRQWALLLEAGTDIITSLELLKLQSVNHAFQDVLDEVIIDVRRGARLSTALARHPSAFPRLYLESVRVAEQVGGLETILKNVADHMDKQIKSVRAVKGALRYPMIVAGVAFVVIGILIMFVLPAFSQLYSELGAELPLATTIVMGAVTWAGRYGPYVMAAMLAAGLVIYLYARTPSGKMVIDRQILKLPLMGRVVHLNELALCCRTISILHKAGFPVSEILDMVIDSSNNAAIKTALTRVQQDVLKGEGLARPMAKDRLFMPMMVQMVAVGEASGSLDNTMLATAESYGAEADERIHAIVDMIQPAIIVVLGVIVGGIATSLIAAMYSIYGQMS